MTTDKADPRERIGYVQGGRPHFFPDPAVDKLLAITMALLGEVCVLRERLDAHERLAASRGIFDPAAVAAFIPDATAAAARDTLRRETMERVLSVLTEDVLRLRAEAGAADGKP
jgi:hypothetical protein